jgi:hypothetical protein
MVWCRPSAWRRPSRQGNLGALGLIGRFDATIVITATKEFGAILG